MKRRCRLFTLLLLLLSTHLRAEVSAVDDTGRTITLPQPAQRIISLAPHATELLFAAGTGERLAGVVKYSDWPPAARDIPRVGGYKSLDMETILALQPDLVVAWQSGNPQHQLQRLEKLGLAVFITEPRGLDDIPALLEKLGRLAGTDETAQQSSSAFRQRRAALAERYAQRPTVDVFYQIWHRPLMTVNGEHTISHTLALCGGRNVFARLSSLAPQLDTEAVFKADPEVIIASGMGEARPEWLDDWRRWPRLKAVQRDNLFFIPPELLQRPTPRLLDGAALLCEQLEQARRRREVQP